MSGCGGTLDQSQVSATIFGTDSQAVLASDQGSVPQPVTLEFNNTTIDSVNSHDNASASLSENVSRSEENDDQDDSESLISFSEAEDTIACRLDEQIHDVQIPLELFLKNNSLATREETKAYNDNCKQPNENVTPNDTVGVNEFGDFVAPEIKFFEDAVTEDDLTRQNEQPRLSLDNVVIFSLPTEQGLLSSPPKRQISLNEEKNVNFSLKTFLTHP